MLVMSRQAYWPFHKTQCRRNEFADAIEEQEPKFAAWMRAHGKQAVLKDDEVDRLERSAQAASGPSRQVHTPGRVGGAGHGTLAALAWSRAWQLLPTTWRCSSPCMQGRPTRLPVCSPPSH